MRVSRSAAWAASSVLGAGVVAVAAARYAASVALRPARGADAGPAGFEGRLTVHAPPSGETPEGREVSEGQESARIVLTRSLTSQLPGTYGLTGDGFRAVVGEVVEDSPHPEADTVGRRLERVTSGAATAGTSVGMTPLVCAGTPRDALGIEYDEVDIPGELGPLPAWFVPGERDTWVLAVHGLGSTREHPLSVLPVFRDKGLPVLSFSYRGDPDAPAPVERTTSLGLREWRDLDAVLHYAVRHGARRVVLHGWSTGATMALIAAVRSDTRDAVSGLVLDSPVLDPHATLRALTTRRGTPAFLLPLAVRAAEGRVGLHPELLEEAADPRHLAVPVLLFHGPDDAIAPWRTSQAYAAWRPDLVTLRATAHARHAAMRNVDPAAYDAALRHFLTPLL